MLSVRLVDRHDLAARGDALIADERTLPGDQSLDLVLGPPAKGTTVVTTAPLHTRTLHPALSLILTT
jgi:hypothetical protein